MLYIGKMNNLPPTRNENIVVQEAGVETLIYDLTTNKAYCLNETTAKVFHACGNNRTFADLRREHNFTDDLIYLTLDELAANNLIADYQSNYFSGLSRREVIRKVGLATMVALPVISSLVAPQAAHAASACVNAGGAAAGVTVTTIVTNPFPGTGDNQNYAAGFLRAQCCSNVYRDFISDGCSSGVGATCEAEAVCT